MLGSLGGLSEHFWEVLGLVWRALEAILECVGRSRGFVFLACCDKRAKATIFVVFLNYSHYNRFECGFERCWAVSDASRRPSGRVLRWSEVLLKLRVLNDLG